MRNEWYYDHREEVLEKLREKYQETHKPRTKAHKRLFIKIEEVEKNGTRPKTDQREQTARL